MVSKWAALSQQFQALKRRKTGSVRYTRYTNLGESERKEKRFFILPYRLRNVIVGPWKFKQKPSGLVAMENLLKLHDSQKKAILVLSRIFYIFLPTKMIKQYSQHWPSRTIRDPCANAIHGSDGSEECTSTTRSTISFYGWPWKSLGQVDEDGILHLILSMFDGFCVSFTWIVNVWGSIHITNTYCTN